MSTRDSSSGPPPGDRRSGRDRRQHDKGLPAGRERRRNVEMRQPEVAELEISPSDWARLHAETQPGPLGGDTVPTPLNAETRPADLAGPPPADAGNRPAGA